MEANQQPHPGGKRDADTAFPSRTQPAAQSTLTTSPYMSMFENFRDELDAHHDRRERIIKASRDITAASKKIIFTLQRTRQIGHLPASSTSLSSSKEYKQIQTLYRSLGPDLDGLNAFRYERQITGGTQEFLEAMLFRHYLATGELLSFRGAEELFLPFAPVAEPEPERPGEARRREAGISPSPADYLLAVFDAIGEIMRFAITSLASLPAPPSAPPSAAEVSESSPPPTQHPILRDLLALRTALQALDTAGSSVARDIGKKMEVMRECVEKVERLAYARVVRGSERPGGWLPDLEAGTVEV